MDEPYMKLGPMDSEYERKFYGQVKRGQVSDEGYAAALLRDLIGRLQRTCSSVCGRAGAVGMAAQHYGPGSVGREALDLMQTIEAAQEQCADVIRAADAGVDPRKRKCGPREGRRHGHD